MKITLGEKTENRAVIGGGKIQQKSLPKTAAVGSSGAQEFYFTMSEVIHFNIAPFYHPFN